MKGDKLSELAEQAIKVELRTSSLYIIFHSAFPEDADFWWKLAIPPWALTSASTPVEEPEEAAFVE